MKIMGTVLHEICQGVEKFIHFKKFLKHAIFRSVCEIAKAAISFIMSVCLSVDRLSLRMEQLGSHWTGSHQI